MKQTAKDLKAWQQNYLHARQARYEDAAHAPLPATWSARMPAYACGGSNKKKEVSHV